MDTKVRLGRYRHFKGKLYEVTGIAIHSETLEKLVIYRALYDSAEFGKNALWARPADMFMGETQIDGKAVPRFEYIGKLEG